MKGLLLTANNKIHQRSAFTGVLFWDVAFYLFGFLMILAIFAAGSEWSYWIMNAEWNFYILSDFLGVEEFRSEHKWFAAIVYWLLDVPVFIAGAVTSIAGMLISTMMAKKLKH